MTLHYSLANLADAATRVIEEATHKTILFNGDMGAGKTTLITEICKQLGVTDTISSPTYALVNEYDAKDSLVYHFDFYRIQEEEEAYAIGFDEYLERDAWVFIEWPSKIPNLIPEAHSTITIATLTDTEREVNLVNT